MHKLLDKLLQIISKDARIAAAAILGQDTVQQID
jgi:hypothetical protein